MNYVCVYLMNSMNAINPLLDTTLFKKMNFKEKTKMLINFLSAVEDVLIESEGNSKRLSMTVFFKALFGVLMIFVILL